MESNTSYTDITIDEADNGLWVRYRGMIIGEILSDLSPYSLVFTPNGDGPAFEGMDPVDAISMDELVNRIDIEVSCVRDLLDAEIEYRA